MNQRMWTSESNRITNCGILLYVVLKVIFLHVEVLCMRNSTIMAGKPGPQPMYSLLPLPFPPYTYVCTFRWLGWPEITIVPATMAATDPYTYHDPLPPTLREGDHFVLHFADNREIFGQAVPKWKNSRYPLKINKRKYSTHNLIGLRYGSVLEVGRDQLVPLEEGEDLLPDVSPLLTDGVLGGDGKMDPNDDASNESADEENGTSNGTTNNTATALTRNDNRNLVDDNTSQKLSADCVQSLKSETAASGSSIVAALISNSSTFDSKTAFSQAKYIKRKQLKHQVRCRIVRVTPATMCSAMHIKDAKKICNLREDTLGQILSNANICAGQRVLVFDTGVQGIITASVTRRMAGYGSVLSLHDGEQASYLDVVHRMNFSVMEKQCLKWIHIGEVFGDYDEKAKQAESLRDENTGEVVDFEIKGRGEIAWPAPLQSHTRTYLEDDAKTEKKIVEFMTKRNQRFARKLTRQSVLELRDLMDGCRNIEENYDASSMTSEMATNAEPDRSANGDSRSDGNESNEKRQCDSLIIATKYDPTPTLLRMLPYLAPSCPFVVYHEFLEPLLETFRTLQNYHVPGKQTTSEGDDGKDAATANVKTPMMLRRNIAVNLRLTDTWFREYQVLDGRTHPTMTMSQNGGYILMGTKLCPKTGTNELDDETMKEIRAKIGGKRKQNRSNNKILKRNKRKNRDGGNDWETKDNKRTKDSFTEEREREREGTKEM